MQANSINISLSAHSAFILNIFNLKLSTENGGFIMGHGKATDWGEDKAAAKKTKLGIIWLWIYFVVYGGFIGIGVFKPELMGMDVGSLNLALVYGLGLIIFALILAFIYNAKCTKMEKEAEDEKDGDA